MTKAEVTLNHKTGPVKITIDAPSPEVAAYIANRIKEVFGASGKKASGQSLFDQIFGAGGTFK